MTTPFGDFGAPPDGVAWGALALAALTVAASLHSRTLDRLSKRVRSFWLVALLALSAAALSQAYVSFYLRGGPRIIDATSYYFQARAFAEGFVKVPIPDPSGSFRGRFLLADPDGHAIASIFPPGYPALLAVGFLVGAPLLVGPVIAALLVVATYALALRCTRDRTTALLAAALSAVCAVLRYHTADTMSHGLAALLLSTATWAALGDSSASAALAGGAAGWLVATRPVSGLVGMAVSLIAARTTKRRAWVAAFAALPVALFVLEQHAATGEWLRSTQLAYYQLADGPNGCFRYGFGAGIGCTFEHGDFVRAHLEHGYGVLAALGTTLRRLKMHLSDAGNAEPFALVLLYSIAATLGPTATRAMRILAFGVLTLVVAYAPFYFDGNYPGGGARFFADALPLEHVLLAWALVRLSLARFALPLAFTGFALHTSYDHEKLANREGGRPMFESSVLEASGVRRGLVFVDTDHGFSLGFDPLRWQTRDGVLVARHRGDAHDAALWEHAGRPPAFIYKFDPSANTAPRLIPYQPRDTSRVDLAGEWPPLRVDSGYVIPTFPACASPHRALELHPARDRSLLVKLALPVAHPGDYRLRIHGVTDPNGIGQATIRVGDAVREVDVRGAPESCFSADGPPMSTKETDNFIYISSTHELSLESIDLSAVH